MGPRHFIAPELEGGGRLDAGPAADVYGLGKVIYYMISGGVVLPRERLDEVGYKEALDGSPRLQLLGLLLRKMICPLATRLQTMDAVIEELDRIDAWERKAPLLAVSPSGLAAAEQLRRNAIERSQAREANAANVQDTERRLAAVKDSVLEWVRLELTDVANQFGDGSTLKMEVREAPVPTDSNVLRVQTNNSGGYCSIGGVELSLREAGDGSSAAMSCRCSFVRNGAWSSRSMSLPAAWAATRRSRSRHRGMSNSRWCRRTARPSTTRPRAPRRCLAICRSPKKSAGRCSLPRSEAGRA
jgi:hypothetical protein